MTALTAPSHLLERHYPLLSAQQCLLFAGDLQDNYCRHFSRAHTYAYTAYYQQQRRLVEHLGQQAYFGLLPEGSVTSRCDRVLYYWPKTKGEAQLQLFSLLNQLPSAAELLLVGENRKGIRSVEKLLTPWGAVEKVDSARHCSLYRFHCQTLPPFDLTHYWQHYRYRAAIIKSLPGVFSSGVLDSGSQLLLENLPPLAGEVLDLGCGAGILGIGAYQRYPTIQLTLSDVSALAVASAQATLAANQLNFPVIVSDIFSDLPHSFDVILANPPFHEGRQISYQMTAELIRSAATHLKPGGKLILVANTFLPYGEMLDQHFGQHQRLAQTKQFKLYQASLPRGSIECLLV